MVPEGAGTCFRSLPVKENLLIGGRLLAGRARGNSLIAFSTFFPMLAEQHIKPAVSGSRAAGERMVAIGRALMVLLCDELSLGLAPIVVKDIYARLNAVVAQGVAVVIVEQDTASARLVLPGLLPVGGTSIARDLRLRWDATR